MIEQAVLVEMKEITFDSINELSRLRPYPKELQKPYFALRPKESENVFSTVKITKLHFGKENEGLDGIIFPFRNLKVPETIHQVIGELSINRFRDKITPQIDIIDID